MPIRFTAFINKSAKDYKLYFVEQPCNGEKCFQVFLQNDSRTEFTLFKKHNGSWETDPQVVPQLMEIKDYVIALVEKQLSKELKIDIKHRRTG